MSAWGHFKQLLSQKGSLSPHCHKQIAQKSGQSTTVLTNKLAEVSAESALVTLLSSNVVVERGLSTGELFVKNLRTRLNDGSTKYLALLG